MPPLEGLYSWTEYKYFKEKFGENALVIAIATPRKVRHQRLSNRPIRPLNEQEVSTREYAEIENLEKGGPIANADYTICKNKSIALVKIQTSNNIHESNSKKSNNLDSLNTELILTSEENIDMYMIKTVLDRYGGHLEFDPQSNVDITTMIIPLEINSNSNSDY